MKNMKKILFLGITLASSLWAKSRPVVIWVNSYTDLNYYKNMAEVYKKKVDPSFSAEVLSYGFMDMPNKLALTIKTGVNPPDLVQLDELNFSVYLNSKTVPFLDLTEKARSAGITQNIHPNRMGLFSYKNHVYGIPQSMSAVVLYYRSDLFQKHNIDPSSLTTWESFYKAGLKIKADRRALLALDWSYIEMLVKQRGSDLFKPDGSINLDDPIVIECIEFLRKMVKNGVGEIPDRGSLYDPTFFSGDVANGEILSVIGAGWYGLDMLAAFTPEELKGTWSFIPLPKWSKKESPIQRRTSTFSGQGLLIFKKSKQVDKAWGFMKWVMTDLDANVERYLQGNSFPCFKPAWVDGRLSRKDPVFNNQSLGAMMLDLASEIPPHIQSPHRAKLANLLREKYWTSLLNEERPVKEMLQELKKEMNKPFRRK